MFCAQNAQGAGLPCPTPCAVDRGVLLLAVFDFGELRIDDVAIVLLAFRRISSRVAARVASPGAAGGTSGCLLRRLLLGVHFLTELLRGLAQRFGARVDFRLVA